MRDRRRRVFLGPVVAAAGCAAAVAGVRAGEPRRVRAELTRIAANRWVKLHELKPGQEGYFRRQAHGGSCFDTKRGRLVLFGSDTHGRSWLNAPRFFDPVARKWSQAYRDDPRASYTVTADGIPVAGARGDHPWSMHTFGAVVYDPGRDEMVVACHPGHMVPGRFTNAVKDLWPKIRRHPTWTYRPGGGWAALPCEAVSFFPFAAAYDSDRKRIIGYRTDGIYELGGEPRRWRKLAGPGLLGYHNNCVYDSKHRALVLFGTNRNSNDVVVYRPGGKEHRRMPTPGARPPPDQHNPMAFEARIGRTVVVVDRVLASASAPAQQRRQAKRQAEVWLYDLGADAWQQVPGATLPFGCGMNYNLEYDPHHGVLLLVTGTYGEPTSVWALRVDPGRL